MSDGMCPSCRQALVELHAIQGEEPREIVQEGEVIAQRKNTGSQSTCRRSAMVFEAEGERPR